jgi:P-type conjugative transfer protein TrbG
MYMKTHKYLAILAFALCFLSGNVLANDAKAVYQLTDGQAIASKTLYEYKPDSQYIVNAKLGNITDISLHPGEEITYIAAGETARWMLDKSVVANVAHVYIKPLAEGISTNLIINTHNRSYRLILNSTSTYTPVVAWEYLDEYTARIARKQNQNTSLKADSTAEKILRSRISKRYYKFKPKGKLAKNYVPTSVWDDGIRTYIEMPEENRYDLPVLYNVEPDDNKLSLVNYRVKGKFFVADRVFNKARLQYSKKSYVEIVHIKRPNKRTIVHGSIERGERQ